MLSLSKISILFLFLISKSINDGFISKSTNGVTLVASDAAEIGREYLFENVYYLVVNDSLLRELVLNQGDLSRVITTKVQDMSFLFYKSTLEDPKIESWDVSNVENMSWMFALASKINPDLSNWDTRSVVNFSDMFHGTKKFNGNISKWDTSKGVYFNGMFFESSFNGWVNDWNMGSAVNLSGMFDDARNFNQPLDKWNTSKVENMGGMFAEAISFNQDISMWDVSNVREMTNMFRNAINFRQDLTHWNVSQIEEMPNDFALNSPVISPNWGNIHSKRFNWPIFFLGMFLIFVLLTSYIKYNRNKRSFPFKHEPYQCLWDFTNKTEKDWITKAELDELLGIAKRNSETQKKIRANFIKNFNSSGFGEIVRIKSEEDGRSYNYKVSWKKSL